MTMACSRMQVMDFDDELRKAKAAISRDSERAQPSVSTPPWLPDLQQLLRDGGYRKVALSRIAEFQQRKSVLRGPIVTARYEPVDSAWILVSKVAYDEGSADQYLFVTESFAGTPVFENYQTGRALRAPGDGPMALRRVEGLPRKGGWIIKRGTDSYIENDSQVVAAHAIAALSASQSLKVDARGELRVSIRV
jgi:hypothetical protein